MNWIAYIDDSRSDTGIKEFVLAGYVAPQDSWTRFRRDWLKALSQHPKIGHFHCVEAYNLRGQFRGWTPTDRDEKVLALAKIIARHELLSLDCRLSQLAYAKILSPVAPFDIRSPYFPLFYGVIATAARMLRAKKYSGSIQFVFDGQGGLGDNTSIWFRSVRASLPAVLRPYLSKAPIFEDDKVAPALQAADALAWHLRRSRMPEYSSENRPVLDLLRGSTHVETWIPDELLQTWARRFASMPAIDSVRGRKGSVRKTFEAAEEYIGRLPEEEQDRAFNQFTNWIEQLAKRHSGE
jgi:hypothetical protein